MGSLVQIVIMTKFAIAIILLCRLELSDMFTQRSAITPASLWRRQKKIVGRLRVFDHDDHDHEFDHDKRAPHTQTDNDDDDLILSPTLRLS